MSDKRSKNRGLGRGLSALMADVSPDAQSTPQNRDRRAEQLVPVERILPNPDQPRRTFDQTALEELAASIREKGVIQPLIVRVSPLKPDHYEIVAGERRWRASQVAQLHVLPVIVREFSDTEVLEVAIIENIQRADLNAIDEAAGYRQLMDRFGRTQDQMATALGKSRSHIANLLRLLTLPNSIQAMVSQGDLSAGHARAIIGHPQVDRLARQIVAQGLSVRDAERLAKKDPDQKPNKPPKPRGDKDPDTLQIEQELSATLKMKVTIDHAVGTEGGKMTLSYRSLDQLDDLLRALAGN